MRFQGLAGAMVVDEDGQVVARVGHAAGQAPDPSAERVALPGGGFLVAVAPPAQEPWGRFVRAFIHEARSPLNALAIYLEVMAGKAGGGDEARKAVAGVLERAQSQIRRLDDLLRLFGGLSAPRQVDGTDLALLVRAAGRFATHEASRRGLRLEMELPEGELAPLEADAGAVADALVAALSAALEAPEGAELRLTLTLDGPAARLVVEAPGMEAQRFADASLALGRVGAQVAALPSGGLEAGFALAAAPHREAAVAPSER